MARRSYRPDKTISKHMEVEIPLSQGSTIGQSARKLGETEKTYYRWLREYGGMQVGGAKRLKGILANP